MFWIGMQQTSFGQHFWIVAHFPNREMRRLSAWSIRVVCLREWQFEESLSASHSGVEWWNPPQEIRTVWYRFLTSWMISFCPLLVAKCIALSPPKLTAFKRAPLETRSSKIAACPSRALHRSGVKPWSSLEVEQATETCLRWPSLCLWTAVEWT